MAKYLIRGSYTLDGIKGVLKDGGTGRRRVIEAAVKAAGGRLEAFYFAFGEDDVVAIVDGLDNVTAAAFALAVAAGGGARSTTTVLLTPEEVDQATKKTMTYTAPGR